MNLDVFKLQASITLDTAEYERAIKQAVSQGQQLSNSFSAAAAGSADISRAMSSAAGSINQESAASQEAAQKASKYSNETKSLTQRIAELKEQHENATSTVNSLTSQYLESAEATGVDSENTEFLKNQLEKASEYAGVLGSELNKLENDLNSANESTINLEESTQKAADGLNELKDKIGGGLANAAKVGAAALSTISAAAIATTKEAVENFAEYEQLVGGVDTLFKASSDKVQKYAERAYKTAGMSANQYMETVTGFSASLLQGLGGDTEKAANIADLAISDMSDNANKMGSDLISIQAAYMSFSRQQYQLLDNLKLGYGGTKSEMERLLADAEKLSGVHFETGNYADMIQAIHIIQKEMDITGTTAKESADTIEGSMNTAKAAWQNLLTGIGRDDADVDKLLGDVNRSVETLADNTIPVVERAFTTLSKTAIKEAKEIGAKLPEYIEEGITDIHKTLKSELGDSADGFFKIEAGAKAAAAAFVTYKATAYVADVAAGIKKVNTAMKQGATLADAMAKAKLANPYVLLATAAISAGVAVKSLIDTQTDLIDEAVNSYDSLSDRQKEVVDSTNDFVKSLNESAKARHDSLDDITAETREYKTLTNRLYELDGIESLTVGQKKEMQTIVKQLNKSIPDLNMALSKETGHLTTQRKEIDATVKSYENKAKVAAAEEMMTEVLKDQIRAEKELKDATLARESGYNKLSALQLQYQSLQKEYYELSSKGLDTTTTIKALKDVTNEISFQKDVIGELNTTYITSKEAAANVGAELNDLKKIIGEETESIDELNDKYLNTTELSTQATESLKNSLETVVKSFTETTNGFYENAEGINTMAFKLGNTAVTLSEDTAGAIGELIDEYDQMVDRQRSAIESSIDMFGGFEADTSTTFADLWDNLNQTNFYINDWATGIEQLEQRGISENLLEELKSMGTGSWDIIYDLNNATDEQLKDYSALWTKTKEDIAAISEKMTNEQKSSIETQINEMSGTVNGKIEDFKEAYKRLGAWGTDGFSEGLSSKMDEVFGKVSDMGDESVETLYNELDEGSPSKKFMQLGKWAVEGFAGGLNDENILNSVDSAARSMAIRAEQAVREELDIHSPSRLFEDIGSFVPQGFSMGIYDDSPLVTTAVSTMMTDSLDNALYTVSKAAQKMSDNLTNTLVDGLNGSGMMISELSDSFSEPSAAMLSGDDLPSGYDGKSVKKKQSADISNDLNKKSLRKNPQSSSGVPKKAEINLIIDGKTFAKAIVPYIDLISGQKIILKKRGVAY